jgi:hypothetical protein
MPYTVKDYFREVTLEHLDSLTLEERLKGITTEDLVKTLPLEERLRGISLEEGLKYFFPDESEEKKRTILEKLLKEEQKNGSKE